MKETTCCFTGHRRLPVAKIEHIVKRLDAEIDNLVHQGVTDFISGGAVGFDQIAASMIIAKRQMGIKVRLIFALPCRDQDKDWSPEHQRLYRNLLDEADEVHYISEAYHNGCMKLRNAYMVDKSAHCICALLQVRTGTSQTVNMAQKKGLNIINTAD